MFTLGKHLSVLCVLASISVQVSVAQQTNLLNISPAVGQVPSAGVGTTVGPTYAVAIENLGQTPVAIKSITITGANASDFAITGNTCPLAPAKLQPGQSCLPGLNFIPASPGTRVATLVIGVVGGATQSALIVGQGLAGVKSLSFLVPDASFPATPIGTVEVPPPPS